MTHAFVISIAVLLAGSAAPQAQPTDVRQIVEQFYPQAFIDVAAEEGEPAVRRQCYAVYDRHPSGTPRTIVAGYSDTSSATVRVLQSDAAGAFHLAAEPQGLDIFGSDCKIALTDLDRDGRSEVIATFGVMVSDATWVFKWDGTKLVNLTPVTPNRDGTQRTLLHNASLADVDGDGVPEIFVVGQYPPPRDGPAEPDRLYRLSSNGYVETGPLVGLWRFERRTGAPEIQRVSAPRPAGALGPFTLHVLNGDSQGKWRVTAAQVLVNNQQVVAPNDLNNTVASLDRDVSLGEQNEVTVRLAGAPGSSLLVILRSRDWDR